MSTPDIGRECVVFYGTTAIAHGKGARIGRSAGVIKDYEFESQDPAVLRQGNFTNTFSIDFLYIDCDQHAFFHDSGDAAISIEIFPKGSGDVGFTLSDVVFTGWELTVEQEGALLESVTGEAKDVVCEVYS